MKAAVLVFPGSNCDRDVAVALQNIGAEVTMVWHKDQALPKGADLVVLPGGFSFGDYLRCGAIAANAPICRAVIEHATRGGYVLGICNGFQILTETKLLPGALMQNAGLKFLGKSVQLEVRTNHSAFTCENEMGQVLHIPIAHHDGNYTIDDEELARLQEEDRVAFRYVDNPNGSTDSIAGVLSHNRRILGMMPHPERAIDTALGSCDGLALFRALTSNMMQV